MCQTPLYFMGNGIPWETTFELRTIAWDVFRNGVIIHRTNRHDRNQTGTIPVDPCAVKGTL